MINIFLVSLDIKRDRSNFKANRKILSKNINARLYNIYNTYTSEELAIMLNNMSSDKPEYDAIIYILSKRIE